MEISAAQARLSLSQEQSDTVMAELALILASDSFSTSKRCRDFLESVVKHTVACEYESLTERFLGVELFGRAVDYETATDAIVRVRANDVRRRLGQYYSGRRPPIPVRIDLIAGGYIPDFQWNTTAEADPSLALIGPSLEESVWIPNIATEPALNSAPKVTLSRPAQVSRFLQTYWWSVALGVVVAATLSIWILWPRKSNFERFWEPVLQASSLPVLSLPASDTFQFEPDTQPRFDQLKPDESMQIRFSDVQSFHNWHVSLPVVQATLLVSSALERKGRAPLVRIGNDLRMDELRGHPVIAIGSFSNPWTKQNVAGLRFTFDRGALR